MAIRRGGLLATTPPCAPRLRWGGSEAQFFLSGEAPLPPSLPAFSHLAPLPGGQAEAEASQTAAE